MTEATKWTAGPWEVGEQYDCYVSIDAPTHKALARVVWQMEDDRTVGKNSPTQEANARLIAASPDMAEALEAFQTAIMHLRPDLPDDTVIDLRINGNHIFYQLPLSRFREARAALLQARGEAG